VLDDYQGALEDLNKANVLEPNNAFTLRIRRHVKNMINKYQGALEDLDKADVLEPNNIHLAELWRCQKHAERISRSLGGP
jgi:tetratricopeptide (TPR) repeat protein